MKDLILPDPLAEHYELVSCLKYSEQASTCLIAVRSSGKTVRRAENQRFNTEQTVFLDTRNVQTF